MLARTHVCWLVSAAAVQHMGFSLALPGPRQAPCGLNQASWGLLQALWQVDQAPWEMLAPLLIPGQKGKQPLPQHTLKGQPHLEQHIRAAMVRGASSPCQSEQFTGPAPLGTIMLLVPTPGGGLMGILLPWVLAGNHT